MKKSDIDESLATLYLRLNGYFTTGLIIHSSEHGKATTEVDCIAIRMPNHRQPDRIVSDAPFLRIKPGLTDLIICEVKSDPQSVTFNNSLKSNQQAIEAILEWAGIHSREKIGNVAEKFQPLLNDQASFDQAVSGISEDGVCLRGLLCCPTSAPIDGTRWLLDGTEILRYAEECFNPPEHRETCSVRYNFQQWGYPLRKIVTWLKDTKRRNPATINDLYRHLNVERQV